ncbi:hypothetical protein A2U01_0064119, partial [Trifolium medium]|nr:hypothetical protein [Trifolium medium]
SSRPNISCFRCRFGGGGARSDACPLYHRVSELRPIWCWWFGGKPLWGRFLFVCCRLPVPTARSTSWIGIAVLLGFVASDSPAATVPFGAVVGC